MILKRHKEMQESNKSLLGDEYKGVGLDYVCCEADGSVVDPSNYSKRFTRILEDCGLTIIRYHDLRYPNLNKIQTF